MDGDDQQSVVRFLENEMLEIAATNNDRAPHRFTFDKVFDPDSSQDAVYENVSGFVESVMNGYDCCIFAYGQTGSGKTFTMQGTEAMPGLNIRAFRHLFQLAEGRRSDVEYELKVSMLEIYNERIRDLLVSEQSDYKIRQKKGGGIYVENLSIHDVKSEQEMLKLMALGMEHRSVGGTKSNAESSRSHSVLTVAVIGKNAATKATYRGKLHLIDLAGSERVKKSGVDGAAMKEAQAINKSLSALGDVICALSKKSKHIPFRNSTLTHLLQSSLGGNCKTLMFTNISPAEAHQAETLNALKFAQRVKTVELGTAKKNVVYSDAPKRDVADRLTQKSSGKSKSSNNKKGRKCRN